MVATLLLEPALRVREPCEPKRHVAREGVRGEELVAILSGANVNPVSTLKLPVVSTQPVPAKKPPVTGEGSKRTMFPSFA